MCQGDTSGYLLSSPNFSISDFHFWEGGSGRGGRGEVGLRVGCWPRLVSWRNRDSGSWWEWRTGKIKHAWRWELCFTQYVVIFKSNFTFRCSHFKTLASKQTCQMPFSVSDKGNECQKEMNKTGLLTPKSSESPERKGGTDREANDYLYCWEIALIAKGVRRKKSRGCLTHLGLGKATLGEGVTGSRRNICWMTKNSKCQMRVYHVTHTVICVLAHLVLTTTQ